MCSIIREVDVILKYRNLHGKDKALSQGRVKQGQNCLILFWLVHPFIFNYYQFASLLHFSLTTLLYGIMMPSYLNFDFLVSIALIFSLLYLCLSPSPFITFTPTHCPNPNSNLFAMPFFSPLQSPGYAKDSYPQAIQG